MIRARDCVYFRARAQEKAGEKEAGHEEVACRREEEEAEVDG